MEVFRLENILFSYPNGVEVFKGLSLRVCEGEFLLITGENGSGKTTLLLIMAGLLFPQKGGVFFRGTPLTEKGLERGDFARTFRRCVGVLFQEPDIQLFSSTLREDIAFGPQSLGFPDVQERVERASALMGLEGLLERPPYSLSWGQKKRAAIATVLSGDHDVLLLDEPTAGLDSRWRERLMTILKGLRDAGKTLVVVAHADPEMDAVASRKIVLSAPEEPV